MTDGHALNVAAHVATGAAALLVGLIPLFSRKGSWIHRWSGRVTAVLGLVVLASAIAAVVLFDPPGALVAATMTAGYQYVSGLRALALKARGPGGPDMLFSVAALSLAAYMALKMGEGDASWTPAIGYSTIGYLLTLTAYDMSRPLWLQAWRRIRPLDHGVKMIGFYSALASAAAGNLLKQWQPWSQLIPSAVGLVAMIVFVLWYINHPIGRGRAGNTTALGAD
jgi:hypothetical protein